MTVSLLGFVLAGFVAGFVAVCMVGYGIGTGAVGEGVLQTSGKLNTACPLCVEAGNMGFLL